MFTILNNIHGGLIDTFQSSGEATREYCTEWKSRTLYGKGLAVIMMLTCACVMAMTVVEYIPLIIACALLDILAWLLLQIQKILEIPLRAISKRLPNIEFRIFKDED